MRTNVAGKGGKRVINAGPGQQDCEALFDALIDEARAGSLVGVVVVALHDRARNPDEQYAVHLAGWARSNPTYAYGASLAALSLLKDRALEHAGFG